MAERRVLLVPLAATLLVLGWAAGLAAALWFDLAAADRELLRALLAPRLGLVVLFVLLVPALVYGVVAPWLARWPRAARRLREEVAIVAAAHAGHEIVPRGAAEMRELAAAVAELARAHAALRRDVDGRIAEAGERLAEETRRLAALMSLLPQAVLVCNRDGRILLYNARATQLFGAAGDGTVPVGLGRPLAGLVDAAALDHGWQQLRQRLAGGEADAVAHVVTRSAGGALLRLQMVPVAAAGDADGAGGYVLTAEDITRAVDERGRRDALLQRLTEGTRAGLGTLRAAAQALQGYDMSAERRQRFVAVVNEEAERLAAQLDDALRRPEAGAATGWPLDDVQVGDLVAALQRRLHDEGGMSCRFDGGGAAAWVRADSHALVQLLAALCRRLAAELGVPEVQVAVSELPPFVRLEIGWPGAALDTARLLGWEAGAAGDMSTVREVLDRHGAELWARADGEAGRARLCLQLMAAAGGAAGPSPRSAARPVHYDFDLLQQAGQGTPLDGAALAALAYTVFDTETTGLRPSEGDEIIAIGAVRIVNQKLLEQERFDRRVRPRRPVRASAEAVHGISTAMLAGEPPLEEVLPPFARFCEGTVLVAHNAAFDMRFLELARERTGVQFVQPVLDTMLLASVVQPGHGDREHQLEAIAARLGVPVTARHEALADAVVTAQVFLRLLPLLADRGIRTLGEARAASLQSALARERF